MKHPSRSEVPFVHTPTSPRESIHTSTTTRLWMETSNHHHHPSSSSTTTSTTTNDSNTLDSSTTATTASTLMNSAAIGTNEYSSDGSTTLPTTTTSSSSSIRLGPTELLLLQRQQSRQQGLRQEYGCTIKNDPYDYIRSVIWLLFKISNVIFPTLGALLTVGLGLNLFCGLGYYYDTTSHTIIIDTLEHIRLQSQFMNSL
jgi:hypothetical protein